MKSMLELAGNKHARHEVGAYAERFQPRPNATAGHRVVEAGDQPDIRRIEFCHYCAQVVGWHEYVTVVDEKDFMTRSFFQLCKVADLPVGAGHTITGYQANRAIGGVALDS